MTFVNLKFNVDPKSSLQRMKRSKGIITHEVHRRLKRLWTGAAREFVLAINEADVIEMDTGMSKASLVPLGRILRISGQINIAPSRGPRKGLTTIDGQYHPNRFKSIPEGIIAGQNAFIFKVGTPSVPELQFAFDIRVFQYNYWEPAWGSLEIGERVFKSYIEKNYDKEMTGAVRFILYG